LTFGGFKPAVRESIGLLLGLASASGAGKTLSALRIAKGASGGKPFAFIDTESRRGLHYADQFKFDHAELRAPFRPSAYAEAIVAADAAGYPVIVVDSMSHEHAGEGGLLDWHEEELNRMAKGDYDKRERVSQAAWIKPKSEHKRMVQKLLQVRAHLILCFRAEDKVEQKKNPQTGKTEFVPKQTLAGFKGWIPICEKNLPFELTASFLLLPDHPGFPVPIKLQEQHRSMFPLDCPLNEQCGERIAEWARGGTPRPPSAGFEKDDAQGPLISDAQVKQFKDAVRARAKELGVEAAPLALTILGCFELENTATISQSLFPEVMDEIKRHGAPAPE
jgi:hypothetical protein